MNQPMTNGDGIPRATAGNSFAYDLGVTYDPFPPKSPWPWPHPYTPFPPTPPWSPPYCPAPFPPVSTTPPPTRDEFNSLLAKFAALEGRVWDLERRLSSHVGRTEYAKWRDNQAAASTARQNAEYPAMRRADGVGREGRRLMMNTVNAFRIVLEMAKLHAKEYGPSKLEEERALDEEAIMLSEILCAELEAIFKPDNKDGHRFDDLVPMIEEAYSHIDPLRKPLPERLSEPKCGFVPPTPGYAGCTREKGHDGPCAHPFAEGAT